MATIHPTLFTTMLLTGCLFDPIGVQQPAPDAWVGVGDGSDDDHTVQGTDEIVNQYTTANANIAAGDESVTALDAAIFQAGDVILIWQTDRAFETEPTAGDTEPVKLSSVDVGAYEFNRVAQISGGDIALERPVEHAYTDPGTQLIRVPQYRNLTIPDGTSIAAPAWNSSRGGIVAILVSETLDNSGVIDVRGGGFHGADGGHSEPARRGESIVRGDWNTKVERTNMTNGGGGGSDHNSGGGGGGHARRGGDGSHDYFDEIDRGGLGGARLWYSVATHIAFGGGGGSGHENDEDAGDGGDGGGIILLRATNIVGTGVYDARGTDGTQKGRDGSGGGGAGGLISLVASERLSCGEANASGGNGGDGLASHGPGGGGAPGRLGLFPDAAGCPAIERYGVAGTRGDASMFGPCHGALPCCGDDVMSGDEQCDDGNRDDGDGCDATCQRE